MTKAEACRRAREARWGIGGVRHGNSIHGRISPEYTAWQNMRGRANGHDAKSVRDYTSRGIRVCDRWLKFENFLADMGRRPHGRTLDRINNDGNYEPGNCRWATYIQQNHNRGRKRCNTSGAAGVSWESRSRKWRARILFNRKEYWLGIYDDVASASRAYETANRRIAKDGHL